MGISFIIPTKDRPKEIDRCLCSLVNQINDTSGIDEIIVVACGESIVNIVEKYMGDLPVSYIHSKKCGQIYQKKIGIEKCSRKSEYIGFIDDDLEFQENAYVEIEKFIKNENKAGSYNFGVSFNVVNLPNYRSQKNKTLKKLLFQIGRSPGTVTRAGINTPIANIDTNLATEWLGGGYTVWARGILDKYPQEEITTRYAAAEDLIYSYPLGKEYPLFVCSAAKVTLGFDTEIRTNREYIIRKQTVAHLYFCSQHHKFSAALFIFSRMIIHILGIRDLKHESVRELIGFTKGVHHFLKNRKTGPRILDD